ncbi:MAG: hypothetical protein ABI599_03880 [Flavobacteriales bacterium]
MQYNSRDWRGRWTSTLWGDATGYYIYLPGLTQHGFKASSVPDTLAEYAGHGFTLDHQRDRLVTKYTYGTALLQLPFYLFAEAVEGFGATSAWTPTHHRAIEVAGVFYWTFGMLLLGQAIHRRWSPTVGALVLTLCCVAFGTNVFYYAFRSPGYSHIYSFFLVALALHVIWGLRGGPWSIARTAVLALICGAIIVTRVIDVLLVMALLGLLMIERPELFRSLRFYLFMASGMFLIVIPQLAYWRFVHGQWLYYTYGNEGFSNAAHPYVIEVLIAPKNGLLPYAPVLFLVPFGFAALWPVARKITALIAVTFALAILGFASWFAWHFGCGYGMRPFVQFVPLAAVPLLALFGWLKVHAKPVYHGLLPLVLIACFVNYRSMLQYDACYNNTAWEWMPFWRNLIWAFFGKMDIS